MVLDLELFDGQRDVWTQLDKFLIGFDEDKIRRAFDFAAEAHKNQKRESGEPYIIHPAWIAKVVAQLSIGEEAVIAALLHDCVEDTQVTIDDIAVLFGDEVALLVAGLTDVRKKTSGIEVHKTSIEVFRQFLFSSVNDVRVLIIRLVDKLHNGFTLEYLPKERQVKFANRAFGIYSPVAEYVGLHYFKRILDDISFQILYPNEFTQTAIMFENQKILEEKLLLDVKEEIGKMLIKNNVNNFLIESRLKSYYSSYKKAIEIGLSVLKDRVGLRVIVENAGDCYTALGLIHSKYKYLQECFDDYISSPKENGYRSIQTTLKLDDSIFFEVQIRTYDMHEFNEFGPASHIAYKTKSDLGGVGYEWVKDLVSWQKSENNINNYTIDVLNKYIYVFTPKGDTIQMPKGSTALDFAYKIHTKIGDRCIGVKINKTMAKLQTELKNGDYVEVLTGKKVNANKDWLNYVTTSDAKESIRKLL